MLTNNPKKIAGIEGFGLTVVEQVPIEVRRTPRTGATSQTKRDKLGHRLHHQDLRFEPEQGRGMTEGVDETWPGERATMQAPPSRSEPARRRAPTAGARGRASAEAEPTRAAVRARGRRARRPGRRSGSSSRGGVAARRSVAVVVARFNGEITQRLLDGALAELDALGVLRADVTVMAVPGAFELPLAAMALAKTRRYACIVALGCVIRGDTPHFDYVAGEAASGLQLAAIETGVPVSFGVLTVDTTRAGRGRGSTRAATPCGPRSRWRTSSPSSGQAAAAPA